MAKVVKAVVIAAVAIAIIVFAPQIAAVLASVVGSLGVTVAAASISSALIGMGISLALTAVATMFTKAPSMSQSLADRLNTSVVPTAARKIVFGTTAAGQDVRFFEGDLDFPKSKIDGYGQVIALASHRISAVKEFYVEEDLVWSNGALVAKHGGFAPATPFRYVLEGKPGNGFAVGSGRYWNATASFTGCAYYAPFWKLDPDVWESGVPQRLTTIVDGCPLYDPRRDSTRGGSGSDRIDNQDTWAFRDGSVEIGRNPALALLTYLIGWRINGKLVWGMGIPAHRIDFDNFRTYANVCEEQVATQAGTTVQRYTVDGVFSTMDSHETIINGLSAAMGSCKMTDRGGVYCLVGGYDDTAGPKIEFTADDLVAPANGASPYFWNPAPPSRERFNIVRGRFANPEELYQLTDWGDPIEQEPLADGIPRTLSLDLGAVSRAETCQRIAKQFLLREYLTPGMFSATFGPKAFAVEVGSVITLSLPAEGWNSKMFRVMQQAESHDMFFQMTLREEDPAIYAWDREEKPLPAVIRPQGHDASKTLTPSNLQLSSASYSGANDIDVSEIHVTWTPELSGRVQGIQIRSRPQGTEGWTEQAALFDPKIGTFTFTSNAPGINVEVEARFRMTSAVYSPWVTAIVQTAAVETVDGTARSNAGKAQETAATAEKKADAADGKAAGAQTVAEQAKASVEDVRKKLPELVTPLLQRPINDLSALQIEYSGSLSKAQLALYNKNLVAIRELDTKVDGNGEKVATDLLNLTSRLDDAEKDIVGIDIDGPIEAAVSKINQTIASANYASSETVDAKIANYGKGVSAWQVNEEKVRAKRDEALVTDMNALGASIRSDLGGDINTVEGAFNDFRSIAATKDDTKALALRVDEMGVKITTATGDEKLAREAAIQTVEKAIANGDKAISGRVDTLSSSVEKITGTDGPVETIKATLKTMQETQVSDNGARATETKNLNSRLDNFNGASFEQSFKTYADKVDGVGASVVFKLQTDQNGQRYATGWGAAIDNGVSEMVFQADKIKFIVPGSVPFIPFQVDATGMYAKKLIVENFKAGSIDSPSLAQAASQKTSFSMLESDKACPRNIETTVISYKFHKEDNDSLLRIMMFAQCYNQDDLDFWGDFVLDGNSKQRAQVRMPFDNPGSRGQAPITPVVFLTDVAAGEHTISFTLTSNETEGPTYVRKGSTLEVTELRRASIGNVTGNAAPVDSGGGGGGDYGGGGGGSGGGYDPNVNIA